MNTVISGKTNRRGANEISNALFEYNVFFSSVQQKLANRKLKYEKNTLINALNLRTIEAKGEFFVSKKTKSKQETLQCLQYFQSNRYFQSVSLKLVNFL